MATYLTNTEDLTTVANAIRSKAGTAGTISFPSGMAGAISSIPVGITDVATAAEMDATLVIANVGKWYRYTGTTTSSYVNGRIYGVDDNTDYLCFTAQQANSTVGMTVRGTPSRGQAFQYSRDKKTWSTFTPGSTTITLSSVGDKVYFKGDNTTVSEGYSIYHQFTMTGSISGSGNIMSLLDSTCVSTTISYGHCFRRLFEGCSSLTTPPRLPATTLKYECYNSIFKNCSNLTTAPMLPATTLESSCYSSMFYGCTSLTVAPALPSTSLAIGCYNNMFTSCTNLTAAPALPATTLVISCYNSMFRYCRGLVIPPALPATTLTPSCYQYMFDGCTSLTYVPALPATTLDILCYDGMFCDCTSLYISDSQTAEEQYAWVIPSSGTFINATTYDQKYMYNRTPGTRSTDGITGAQGESHTRYVRNPPISV